MNPFEKKVLQYHMEPIPGKIAVVSSKPCLSQRDLSLADTPGVAIPCMEIQKNPDFSFHYTFGGINLEDIKDGEHGKNPYY
jgi:malate dehydrogenase (oxaloacetate-decarboxylating)(NADP+)